MNAALGDIAVPHRLSVVEGAGHDLKRGKFDLSAQVVLPFGELPRPAPV
jgi:hypothetical protein